MNLNGKISGEYLVSVVGTDGTERFPLGKSFRPNLVLNSGLDMLFAVGQAGGGFGGVMVFCRVGTSNTAAAVGQTTLFNQLKSSNSYVITAGANGSSSDTGAGTRTHKRTFQFTAEVSNVNYNEVGFSNLGGSGDNLFSRVVFPATVTVNTGEILRVVYQLRLSVGQTITSQAVSISGGGFDGEGDIRVCGSFDQLFGTINSNGSETVNEASWILGRTGRPSYLLTNTAFPGVNTNITPTYVGTSQSDSASGNSTGTYTAGNFFKDLTYSWPPTTPANSVSTIRAISLSGVTNCPLWILDSAQSKANTQTLSLVNRISWNRP